MSTIVPLKISPSMSSMSPSFGPSFTPSPPLAPCDPGYNTVTYSLSDPSFESIKKSKMIPEPIPTIINAMSQKNKSGSTITESITMCVAKKCPDGNYAANIGKTLYPGTNIYGCMYLPDISVTTKGDATATCKAGSPLSPPGGPVYKGDKGPAGLVFPKVCVSLPQIYFPALQ
jgi:hypothetical protein